MTNMNHAQDQARAERDFNSLDPTVRQRYSEAAAEHRRQAVQATQKGQAAPPPPRLADIISAYELETKADNDNGDHDAAKVEIIAGNGHDRQAANNNERPGIVPLRGSLPPNESRHAAVQDTAVDKAEQPTKPLHDKAMAELQLRILDPSATKFTFQFFSDNKNATPAEKKAVARTFHGTLDEAWPMVMAVNTPESQVGVFITVNETDGTGRRKAENIVRARGLICDADGREQLTQSTKVVTETGVAPSMLVGTGRGAHFYYLLADDLPLDQFRPLQEQLNAKLGTDPAVKDLPRVLRLAGALHLKDPNNPRPITLHNQPGEPVRRYRLTDLAAKLGLSLNAGPEQKPADAGGQKAAGDLYVNSELAQQGPSTRALKGDADQIGTGITQNDWFNNLTPEKQNAALDYMVEVIATKTNRLKRTADGGNNDDWFKTTMAIAASGVPGTKDIFIKHASKMPNADSQEVLGEFFDRCQKGANGKIKIGTLIWMAREAGVDLSPWRGKVEAKAEVVGEITGEPDPVIAEMNHCYSAGRLKNKFRVAWFAPDQRFPLQRHVEFFGKDDFLNSTINPKVEVPKFNKKGEADGTTWKSRGQYWFDHPARSEFTAVTFQPGAPGVIVGEDRRYFTLNTFAGFAVVPDFENSETKCSLYLAHLKNNVAGGDKDLFEYIVNWMASGVQKPGDPDRSTPILRGPPGSGKGATAQIYGRIFGRHFLHAMQREHVVGHFNAHQAEINFMFVDEALFRDIASDAEIMKTLTTEKTKLLTRKGIDSIVVPNYARLMLGSNSLQPITIEVGDRRYPAFIVCEDKSFATETDPLVKANGRKAYFDQLFGEADNGGVEALLGFLLARDISKFNAEAIPETSERLFQKLLSAPVGDQAIIELAQEGILPGAFGKDARIARARRSGPYSPPGLLDEMRAHGGHELARLSDNKLTDILKSWGFERWRSADTKGWQAPLLDDLRAAIRAKYPAVKFDDVKPGDSAEWSMIKYGDPPTEPPKSGSDHL